MVAAIGLPIATYRPESAFLAFLLGLLVAMLGALVFGVAILRTDVETIPRTGAWLLVAALPIGLPFVIGLYESRETVGQQGYQRGEFECTLRAAYRLAEREVTPAGQRGRAIASAARERAPGSYRQRAWSTS